MNRALSRPEETIEAILESHKIIPRNPNPSSGFSFLVSKSFRFFRNRAKLPNRVSSKRIDFDGMIVNNFVYSDIGVEMEGEKDDGLSGSECKIGNLVVLSGESSPSSDLLAPGNTLNDENGSSEDSLCNAPHCVDSEVSEDVEKAHFEKEKLEKKGSSLSGSEFEMMKERFSKLLLGEDMSGCGNGVSTALAISNAITNLCATLFGQVWRLEPLKPEKKLMWRREMEWLLSVSDHVVELIPSWQTFPDGTKLEVMTSRPRLDLFINLPALRKLDNMLLEILDSFESCEFCYIDQGVRAPEADGSSSFQHSLPRQEDKWWLPVPRVPPGGLSENSRKFLQHQRDCTNQILKAAMAINNAALAEMDVPNSYLEALPKNGRMSLGDLMHRYMSSDQFTPECLLDLLDLTSDHHAVEIANRVEAAVYVWRRKIGSKPLHSMMVRENSKTSWEMVKDMVSDIDKRELLADRAKSFLLCLKHRFPGLPQTTLDMAKIQYNKDVGKSILESYSRVLESLSFNIVARIDDLIYVDDLSKHSDKLVSISKVGVIAQRTPTLSPLQVISNAKGDRSPYMEINKNDSLREFRLDRILNDYPSLDGKLKRNVKGFGSFSTSSRKIRNPNLI